ncbi:FAD-binding oxidoreductase [Legionella worsleiensis]|nr:FAD-binding oxidoreductase [Legionella worsleiensis]
MRSKKMTLTNFSRAKYSESLCLRPDSEQQLKQYCATDHGFSLLTRGAGLSYSDSCFNQKGLVIDNSRLNHLIDFDVNTGIAICQSGALISDLFLLHPEYIPCVIPGTVHCTLGGAIAHDVHGKNNPQEGSLGHQVEWFDLIINRNIYHCSRQEHDDLFRATLAGAGLTGIITRIGIRLKKASLTVQAEHKQIHCLKLLTQDMVTHGLKYDYQVAWLDLLNPEPRAILSQASHCDAISYPTHQNYSVCKLPFGLIKEWNMRLFNKLYFKSKKPTEKLSLLEFNNPLDKIRHWNRLYGPKGLIQFQAVFDVKNASTTIEQLIEIIRTHKACPTLAVLKLLMRSGEGLLSFCTPGFTLAIDFINNVQAHKAIIKMNQLITELNGRIYLAKDLVLTPEQFRTQYTQHAQFSEILNHYQSTMSSDLSTRLGITS